MRLIVAAPTGKAFRHGHPLMAQKTPSPTSFALQAALAATLLLSPVGMSKVAAFDASLLAPQSSFPIAASVLVADTDENGKYISPSAAKAKQEAKERQAREAERIARLKAAAAEKKAVAAAVSPKTSIDRKAAETDRIASLKAASAAKKAAAEAKKAPAAAAQPAKVTPAKADAVKSASEPAAQPKRGFIKKAAAPDAAGPAAEPKRGFIKKAAPAPPAPPAPPGKAKVVKVEVATEPKRGFIKKAPAPTPPAKNVDKEKQTKEAAAKEKKQQEEKKKKAEEQKKREDDKRKKEAVKSKQKAVARKKDTGGNPLSGLSNVLVLGAVGYGYVLLNEPASAGQKVDDSAEE